MVEDKVGDGVYKIPEANYSKFEKAIAKLSKKCERLMGEAINPIVFGYEMVDTPTGQIKVYEVLVGGPKPKLNGWSFIGRIDHANKELGNIVRAVPGKEVPELYRTRPCTCDHCNINRFRRDTYIVQHDETLDVKQVGTSCLRDFLGHDSPEKIAKLAELLGYAAEAARGYEQITGEERRYIPLDQYLAHVARLIRVHGYFVSRTVAKDRGCPSTADVAHSDMYHDLGKGDKLYVPALADAELAEKAIEWAQTLGDNGAQLNDYLHNLKVIAASGCCEYRSIGYAASLVNAYMREQNLYAPRADRKVSQHLGKVGERMTLQTTLKMVRAVDTSYGGAFLHRFETDDGNVLTTFAGKKLAEEGDRVKLKGTVTRHDEYKGTKQTIVNRCKAETAF